LAGTITQAIRGILGWTFFIHCNAVWHYAGSLANRLSPDLDRKQDSQHSSRNR